MGKSGAVIATVVMVTLVFAVSIGLKYSQASLLFGAVALVLAPVAIHKIPNVNWASGVLIGLAVYASFPFKKLFQIDGFLHESAVTLSYFAVLWIAGMGWKRNWKFGK